MCHWSKFTCEKPLSYFISCSYISHLHFSLGLRLSHKGSIWLYLILNSQTTQNYNHIDPQHMYDDNSSIIPSSCWITVDYQISGNPFFCRNKLILNFTFIENSNPSLCHGLIYLYWLNLDLNYSYDWLSMILLCLIVSCCSFISLDVNS